MDFEVIEVNDRDTLDYLYSESALTIEGLAESSFGELIDWVEKYTPLKKKLIYKIKGKIMNDFYGLTGNNAYNDDFTLASISLEDVGDFSKIIIPRFDIGGRWFDDIVDNNRRREER